MIQMGGISEVAHPPLLNFLYCFFHSID